MYILFESKVFCCCKCYFRCRYMFYSWVICKVYKYYRMVDCISCFKIVYKKFSIFKSYINCSKYNGEFRISFMYFCLFCNLNCKIGMW